MIFVSAGHCADRTSSNYDPGAPGVQGRTEADETVRLRDKVVSIIKGRGMKYIQDANNESLRQYLSRIHTGSGSVIVEFHFNAFDGRATGVEAVVGDDYDKLDYAMAKEMATATSSILNLPLRADGRGVITEGQSHRGKLGLMREEGTVVLMEVCFIDNAIDMAHYDAHIDQLAEKYAGILIKYENMIS